MHNNACWILLVHLSSSQVVFGLGMRLLVHKHTKLENGVLRNREQPSSAMNNLFDYGKFEAMKTLSSRTVPHNCEHQFCVKN